MRHFGREAKSGKPSFGDGIPSSYKDRCHLSIMVPITIDEISEHPALASGFLDRCSK